MTLAAVQATDEQLIAPTYLTWLSAHPANFLHQTFIAGLVKHLSPYTGRIPECTAFAHRNQRTLFLTGCFQ